MNTLSASISARELREGLSDVLGRAGYAHERVGITRHGKLAAVVIGVEDLEALEAFEMARDVHEFASAQAEDTGERISLSDLRDEIAE